MLAKEVMNNDYMGSGEINFGWEFVFFRVPAVSVRFFGDLSSARAFLNKPKAPSASIAIVAGSGKK